MTMLFNKKDKKERQPLTKDENDELVKRLKDFGFMNDEKAPEQKSHKKIKNS